MTGLPTKVRRQVADRDRGCCLRCGTRGTNVQHRIGRGMGGTSRAEVNDLAALVTLCGSGTTGCHGYITSHPEEAYATDWAIRRSASELASEVPLVDLLGRQFFLTDEGGLVYTGAGRPMADPCLVCGRPGIEDRLCADHGGLPLHLWPATASQRLLDAIRSLPDSDRSAAAASAAHLRKAQP